jgi:hypothetical protein
MSAQGCNVQLGALDVRTGRERFRRSDLASRGEGYGRSATYRAIEDAFFAVAEVYFDPASCGSSAGKHVVRFDPADGRTLWSLPAAHLQGELALTASDTLLFALWDPVRRVSVLHHADFDGRPLWSCELPQDGVALYGLHQGRAFLQMSWGVAAVDLPGLDLATSGWLTEWGDPEHRRRPR